MAASHVLYLTSTCPYCRKVLLFMSQHGIELEQRDISVDEDARMNLIAVGGKAQVPCLFIDGSPLYESDDIIDYLSRTFADGAQPSISPEEQARMDDGAACSIFKS